MRDRREAERLDEHDHTESDDAESDDAESDEAPDPLEGLLNPEEGVNSPASDAAAQPPG